ncbi:ATP-binding protein [Pantoea agglomerans]|uniref:ATP-binding protein n=1 Tax=Enterobacter agglomerans TaxID=549 RepID=UPI002413C36B|nr:ATP-binding protein [Pantoea agglomerans]
MLNFNQKKERDELRAKLESLREEMDFATEHKKPWQHAYWKSGEITQAVCDRHGGYELFTLLSEDLRGNQATKCSRCPHCIRQDQEEVESRLRELRVADLLDEAGIGRRFAACEFENYQPVNPAAAKNLNICQRYVSSWEERLEAGTGLVMNGSCGTGKNHLAVSIAKNLIRNHLARVEFTDVMRLTRAVKNTWRSHSERTEDDVLAHFSSLDLLIIDEVGVQFGTQAESVTLQEVINARYENVLPTILISNLTLEQLSDAIGERIVDRVTDGGRNRLAFGWESYRSTKGVPAV